MELTALMVIALLNREGIVTIETDVCDKQLGCVPQREHDEGSLPRVRHWFQTLDDAERRCNSIHREYFAFVLAVLLLRSYIEASPYTFRTENGALKWFLDLKEKAERLETWRVCLTIFQFRAIHRAAIIHQGEDALFHPSAQNRFEESIHGNILIECIVY